MAHSGSQNANEALAGRGGQTLRDAGSDGDGERTVARRWPEAVSRRRMPELLADVAQRSLGRLAEGRAEPMAC